MHSRQRCARYRNDDRRGHRCVVPTNGTPPKLLGSAARSSPVTVARPGAIAHCGAAGLRRADHRRPPEISAPASAQRLRRGTARTTMKRVKIFADHRRIEQRLTIAEHQRRHAAQRAVRPKILIGVGIGVPPVYAIQKSETEPTPAWASVRLACLVLRSETNSFMFDAGRELFATSNMGVPATRPLGVKSRTG